MGLGVQPGALGMAEEPGALSRRKLQGIVDARGRLTHWKCTGCSLTLPIREEDMGLEFSQETTSAFEQHKCEEHQLGSTTDPAD